MIWETEFAGWDDWLGIPRVYADAIALVTPLHLQSEAAYLAYLAQHPEERLPARPDLYYREEWAGWEAFLGAPR